MSTPAERKAFAKEVAYEVLAYKNEKVVGKNGLDVYAHIVKAGQAKELNEKLDLILHALSGPRITEIVKAAGIAGANVTADELAHALLKAITTSKEA